MPPPRVVVGEGRICGYRCPANAVAYLWAFADWTAYDLAVGA